MGMTPQTPNFSQSLDTAKDFWSTKQGSFGRKVIIGVIVVVAGVLAFNAATILTALGAIVWAGANLLIASTVLAVLTSPFWCPPVRLLLRNIVQSSIRWSYKKLVQKDPIGILLNNRDQMRDQLTEFDKAVSQLAGSKQRLETDLQTQMDTIRQNKALADSCQRKVVAKQAELPNSTGNARMQLALDIQQLQLTKQNYDQAGGIAEQTIKAEQPILQQTDKMYDQLCRLRNLADSRVQSLTMQADMYSKQRKSILEGQRGLIAAGHIIKGDPHELELVDMAVEALNTETADTIGAMKDFNRNSDKYLTDMDIQNDAKASAGQNVFAELENKLALPESIVGTGGAQPTVTDAGVVIPSDNDYMKFLK